MVLGQSKTLLQQRRRTILCPESISDPVFVPGAQYTGWEINQSEHPLVGLMKASKNMTCSFQWIWLVSGPMNRSYIIIMPVNRYNTYDTMVPGNIIWDNCLSFLIGFWGYRSVITDSSITTGVHTQITVLYGRTHTGNSNIQVYTHR